jgi:hypothetical protein
LTADHLPRLHLTPSGDNDDGPEGFSERELQTRLAHFWRLVAPCPGAEHDVVAAEERYDRFCREILATLPPEFALVNATCVWDKQVQRLPLQRQMLHVAIFDSIRHNFAPVLMLAPAQVQSWSVYKQVLVSSQRRALAAAALRMLDSVSKLHALLGRSHTRFTAVVQPTFEAGVMLGSLVLDDPLAWEKAHVTRERCRRAAQNALLRLEMLAEISNLAKVGAGTLARLMAEVPPSPPKSRNGGTGLSVQTIVPDLDHFLAGYWTNGFSSLRVEGSG